MNARRSKLERYEANRRGRDGDYRKRGAWIVVSYWAGEVEYRRAYWAEPNTPRGEMWDNTPREITV